MATQADLLAIIGGFSAPDKMPSLCWSIPAIHCKLGSLLYKRAGSTCEDCYARKGLYVMPNTRDAMARRWAILQRALSDPLFAAVFVDAFAELLTRKAVTTRKRITDGRTVRRDGRWFRWHDSGDLQSVDHLRLLVAIAENAPSVIFWLPTRESGIVAEYLAGGESFPDNFRVRLSVPMKDRAPTGVLERLTEREGIAASGVHTTDAPAAGDSCPAYQNDGHCGDCRQCWDTEGSPIISYPLH